MYVYIYTYIHSSATSQKESVPKSFSCLYIHVYVYISISLYFSAPFRLKCKPAKQVARSSFGAKPEIAMAESRSSLQKEVTKFAATSLGGPARLRGHIILCDLPTATSASFWEQETNIGAIVNCIGVRHGRGKIVYPRNAENPLVLFVDARNSGTLGTAFEEAAKAAEKALEQGKDVLVHCRQTFHRGPGVAAGLLQRLCGVDYKVC